DGSYFYLSGGMADTGFSEAIVPTDNEIKAYFYGHRMCHSDGRSPYYKSEVPYNPTTWEEWEKATGTVADNTGIELTADGTNNWNLVNTNMKPLTKYGLLMNIVENTLEDAGCYSPAYVTTAPTIVANTGETGNKKVVFTSRDSISTNKYGFKPGQSAAIGGKIKLRDIRIYELPSGSQIEADFTNLTADELAIKYPFDGLNVKHWKKLVGTEAEIQASITSTLPTASYEGFTPYKMIYELAEPIEEQHDPVTLPTYYPTTVVTTTNNTPAELATTATVKVEET
ncbi:MAG TPA: hypothetical protein PKN28_06320, partial [Clostridiales bacterium]|nr:hypothetical protein [Clostridiales bacterium]